MFRPRGFYIGLYAFGICSDATQIYIPASSLFLQPTKLAFAAITVIFPLTLIPSSGPPTRTDAPFLLARAWTTLPAARDAGSFQLLLPHDLYLTSQDQIACPMQSLSQFSVRQVGLLPCWTQAPPFPEHSPFEASRRPKTRPGLDSSTRPWKVTGALEGQCLLEGHLASKLRGIKEEEAWGPRDASEAEGRGVASSRD